MTRDNQAEQRFERNLLHLPAVFDFVDTFLNAHRVRGEEAYAITLAVEELFTNTVKYSSSAAEPIHLRLSADGERVVVIFYDSGGTPFDVTRATDVDIDRPTDEVRPGGLGIHLIRCVMDEVDYSYTDNANIITMTKKLE